MKNKSILALLGVVTVTALTTLGLFRGTRIAKAQDDAGPPIPIHNSDQDPISSGMVGIVQGQTLRLSVVNLSEAGCPCWRVILNFRDAAGELVRRSDGSIVQQQIELEPGRAQSLDLSYDELPPSPIRQQLRAVARLTPPDGTNQEHKPFRDQIITTVEIFDNATGRTEVSLTSPAVLRGFNPQPDPPRVAR